MSVKKKKLEICEINGRQRHQASSGVHLCTRSDGEGEGEVAGRLRGNKAASGPVCPARGEPREKETGNLSGRG